MAYRSASPALDNEAVHDPSSFKDRFVQRAQTMPEPVPLSDDSSTNRNMRRSASEEFAIDSIWPSSPAHDRAVDTVWPEHGPKTASMLCHEAESPSPPSKAPANIVHVLLIVWVKVTTRDGFFHHVAEAAAHVIQKAAPMRAALDRRLSTYSSSLSTRRLRSSTDDDDFSLDSREAQRKQEQHEAAGIFKHVTYSRLDTHELDTSALAHLAHAGPTLVVLNDFERLVVTAGDKERAREHCRLLLRGLLESCSNLKVLMTCSSFSGIGQVHGVTEQIIPLGRMTDDHTAFLLLQRDPELKRRATNPNRLQPPPIAPPHVVTMCASHPFIKRLKGQPYAVGLGVAILNKLFAYERMAKEVCEGAGASATPPPLSRLEPLDRALRVLDFPEVFDPDLRRLRDELKYVVEYGRGYRPETEECRPPPAQASPWDVARSWFGSTSPAVPVSPATPASAWDLGWFGSSAHPAPPAPPAPSDPKSPQQRLRELNEVQEFITPAEYEQKKQEILAAI